MNTRTWITAAAVSLATILVTAVPTWAVEATPSPTPTVEQPEVPDGSTETVDPQPEPDTEVPASDATHASDDSSAPPADPVDGEPIPPAPPVEHPAREGVFETPQMIAPPSTAESVEVATPDALGALVADRAAADIEPGDSIFVGAAVAPLVDLAESVYPGEGIAQTALQARPDLVAGDLPRASEGDLVSVEVLPQLTNGAIPGASFAARFTLGSPGTAEWLEVAFDVSGFADALGADYGDRMQFVALPECSVTTPEQEGCLSGVPLELRRDVDGIVRLYVPAGAMDIADISGRFSVPMSGGSGSGTIIAAVSGADGQAGTFKATDLAPRGTWGVTEPHGGFTYSIPIATPPVQAGPVPDVSLNYSSQSTDGKTSASNSQASIIGEGWSMPTSYIERILKPCADEGMSGSTVTCWESPYSGNKIESAYVLSLAGSTHELVYTGAGPVANSAAYIAASDPSLKVVRYYGDAGRATNGDNDGEYFEVKTPDGSVYRFGFKPSNVAGENGASEATNSVADQPVVGNESGEPGYGLTNNVIADQGYRFMLDLVVDVHGNAATYFYTLKDNKFTAGGVTYEYVRDIQLKRVEYGQRYDEVAKSVDAAQAMVELKLVKRCVENAQFTDGLRNGDGGTDSCPTITLANAVSYPDVPMDLQCTDATCNPAQNSATFYSAVRLDRINTSYRLVEGATVGDWIPVETTQLIQAFPTTDDGSARSLWLDSVYTRGWGEPPVDPEDDDYFVATGDEVDTYLTKFTGIRLKNRVDWDPTPGSGNDPQRALDRMRIAHVFTDMGGRVDVTYARPDASLNAPGVQTGVLCPDQGKDWSGWASWAGSDIYASVDSATNGRLCYAVKRGSEKQLFHNYVVTSVALVDPVADTPTQTHSYVYGGTPAYARADSLLHGTGSVYNPETFSSFRGFRTVASTLGAGVNTTTTTNQYYRGISETLTSLHDSSTRADAADSRLQGRLESSKTTISPSGTPVTIASSKNTYAVISTATAPTWTFDGAPSSSSPHIVQMAATASKVIDGSWNSTTTTSIVYDTTSHRLPLTSTTVTSDSTGASKTSCTATGYVSSASPYLVLPSVTTSYDGTCASGTVVSKAEVGYDGQAPGATSGYTRGLVTEERTYTTASSSVRSLATYDELGRITAAWTPGSVGTGTWAVETAEPADVTFAYGTDGDLWTTTTTRALGQVSTTWTERGHGSTIKAHGATDRDWTHYQYDALGLLVAGWAPAQWGLEDTPELAEDYPTSLFVYDVYADGPSLRSTPVAVASAPLTLDDGEEYIGHPLSSTTRRSYTFLDGWGRVLEQHGVAPDGSADRVVTATGYNELGQVAWTSAPFAADGVARFMDSDGTTALVNAAVESLPLTTRFTYDALGRQTLASTFEAATAVSVSGVLQDTETSYSGALTTVKAADGSQVRTKVDVLGRMTEQRAIVSGMTDQVTTYAYATLTTAGEVGFQRVTVTDPQGKATVFTSNLAGQKVALSDPNAGKSSYVYDKDGRVTQVTSNAGITNMVYDALGRMISRTTTAPGSVSSSFATWDYVEPGETGEATDLGLLRSESATTATGIPSVGNLTTVTSHAYDDLHRPVSTTVTLPSNPTILGELPAEPYVTTYGYDDLGQQTVTGYPGVGGLDVEYASTGYALNGTAQTLTLKDAVENPALSTQVVTAVSTDPVGQLLERTYGNGVSREYGWDTRRQLSALSAVFDPDGSGSEPEVKVQDETFTRDVLGRITRSENLVPDAEASTVSAECFKYDGFNRLKQAWTVSGLGVPAACGTNPPSSPSAPAWDESATAYAAWWSYTAAGRIQYKSQGSDVRGLTSEYAYQDSDTDGAGPDVASAAAVTSVSQYGYESVYDRFDSGTYDGGWGDQWDGPWVELDEAGTPAWDSGHVHVDSPGVRLEAAAGEEVALARTVDVEGKSVAHATIELDEWSDSLVADDVLQLTATADGDPLRTVSMQVAGGNGLPSGTGASASEFLYMDMSELLPAQAISLELRVLGGTGETGVVAGTFHVRAVEVRGEWEAADTFAYDPAGRMTQRTVDGVVTDLTWDALSNLTSTTVDGVTTVYAYDAGGQRVAQATLASGATQGTATAYVAGGEVTDPNTDAGSLADMTATRFYTFGGATVAVRSGGGGFWLLFGDKQGSAQIMMPATIGVGGALEAATATDAANVQRTAYEPYGARRGAEDLDINRGWLGQTEDTGTGLTYLNARYYDPVIGRFLSPDPLMDPGDPRTLDPYMYAANNPTVFSDALGLRPDCTGLKPGSQGYKDCMAPPSGKGGKTSPTSDGRPRSSSESAGGANPTTQDILRGLFEAGMVMVRPDGFGCANMDCAQSHLNYSFCGPEKATSCWSVAQDEPWDCPIGVVHCMTPDEYGWFLLEFAVTSIVLGVAFEFLGVAIRAAITGLRGGSTASAARMAANVADDLAANSAKMPFREDTSHIFRNARGHFADDTALNRSILQDTVAPENLVSTTNLGQGGFLQKFTRLLENGDEIWVEVRNAKEITNGGINLATPAS